MSITVTKPYLPPKDEYLNYVSEIFDRGILTNQGANVRALEAKLSAFLGTENFHYVTNGTIALQLALKALGIEDGEVITTPFSYVATTSSILWERCTPVFVDIEPDNFTIDPTKIEAAITPKTRAIMPVHVFGYACDVDAIQKIADKHNLKVVYDAAHALAKNAYPDLYEEFLLRATHTAYVRLFGIPVLKIIRQGSETRCLLFHKIPVLSFKSIIKLRRTNK